MVLKFEEYFNNSLEVKRKFSTEFGNLILKTAEKIKEVLLNGNKILICGNGGSAADAQHFAAELLCRFEKERPGFPAIALNADTSILTAWSNDYSFETVFERQVETLGKPGDLLVAISTSGNSVNIIRAVEKARKLGIFTIGLLGRDGGKVKNLVELPIIVSSNRTAFVQECHIMIYHFWCEVIEENFE